MTSTPRNETEFRRAVMSVIEQAGGDVSFVESKETSPGIPDLNWCIQSLEGWTELKYSYKGELPEIRPLQRRWTKNRIKAGGYVSWMCYHSPSDMIYIISGDELPNIKTMQNWIDLGEGISYRHFNAVCPVIYSREH
jgi:hypothetical protein